ncbi:MAG: GHKL domain-containing protein [Lachnospiraceae bacterium]|nr:GHKL domain-containing protein [Lachnospiraceae bacterium]
MFGLIIRSIFLSLIMGMSCQVFFETIVPRRKMRYDWIQHTTVLAFAAGFMVIAVTKIPPYILQPVRVIIIVFLVAQIYFRISVKKNLMLSVVFCGIYWIASAIFASAVYIIPLESYEVVNNMMEPVLDIGYLCLMVALRYRFRKRARRLPGMRWGKFTIFSLIGIMVSIAFVMMTNNGSIWDTYARLAALTGFATVYVLGLYYMVNMLEKESEMQELRLLHEQTQNQMNLYQSMKERYEQQRRFWHDYKNQLNCIQGMIESGRTKEAMKYISDLNGSLRQGEMCVNTDHVVVNVMLNRKYQEACEKGIVMTMVSGDLSGLTISEEDIVTLLGNLLDNAIEACEKLTQNKVIQFKMVVEDNQLVLSIRNPVKETVRIKDNRIVTSKRNKALHGIGLLNVESVIRKNRGTSVLKCEGGWFSFAAMIPIDSIESIE